jgi:hypothetical protein
MARVSCILYGLSQESLLLANVKGEGSNPSTRFEEEHSFEKEFADGNVYV